VWIEPRIWQLLGKCTTNWAMPSAPPFFWFVFCFWDKVLLILLQLALNLSLFCLQTSWIAGTAGMNYYIQLGKINS
jgi:hypothetical protein